jgi:hypothetical protein
MERYLLNRLAYLPEECDPGTGSQNLQEKVSTVQEV